MPRPGAHAVLQRLATDACVYTICLLPSCTTTLPFRTRQRAFWSELEAAGGRGRAGGGEDRGKRSASSPASQRECVAHLMQESAPKGGLPAAARTTCGAQWRGQPRCTRSARRKRLKRWRGCMSAANIVDIAQAGSGAGEGGCEHLHARRSSARTGPHGTTRRTLVIHIC